MSVQITTREYKNFGKCIFLDNGLLSVGITVDVGPRVIYCALKGRENVFFEDTDRCFTEKVTGGGEWVNYGGHRLWCAPEVNPETYSPDNSPVEYTVNGNTVTVTPPATPFGKDFSMEVTLDDERPVVSVTHRIRNVSDSTAKYAAWAISGMCAGGVEKIPLSTAKTGYLGNRTFALWDYSDIRDPRFDMDNACIRLRQDEFIKTPFKIGVNVDEGFAAYAVKGQIFVKTVPEYRHTEYPDFACNFESYTNHMFLECENIGEYREYAPGEEAVLTEKWYIIDNPDNDEPVLERIRAALERNQ